MNLCVVLVLEACVQYGQFGLCAVAVCNPVVQYANGLLNKCLFVVRFIRNNCLSPFRQYSASVAFGLERFGYQTRAPFAASQIKQCPPYYVLR